MSFYHQDAYNTHPVQSWWHDSAAPEIDGCAPLDRDIKTDIAVIGAGYAGLNAALRLALEFGQQVVVLDRADIGWGASGRNGGFCCLGGSLHDPARIGKKYGDAVAQSWSRMMRQSIDHVENMLDQHQIEVDLQAGGERAIAHKPGLIDDVRDQVAVMRDRYGFNTRFLDKQALVDAGANGPHFHAAIQFDHGFGLHPQKYVQGLARAARDAGIRICQRSDVTKINREADGWRLRCPGGTVRAQKILLATNGYTMKGSPFGIDKKLVPALSNILTTRPLTDAELDAQGWTSSVPTYDEGALLHYFRLLPDKRMMFGGRGGLSAEPGALDHMYRILEADFRRYFPAWRDAGITHRWNGLVCIIRDGFPHLTALDSDNSLFAALGWHGNGVAMASYGGWLTAGLMNGQTDQDIAAPLLRPLPGIPFPALRPIYMKARYAGFHIEDRLQK